MPEYLAPGVYVEEVATGPRPIEGVSTSTTGFAGPTERGPTRPRLVTSWQDYTRWFGGYIDREPFNVAPFNMTDSALPYAVRGFFDNGGQRLFVARVTALPRPAGGGQPASPGSMSSALNLAGGTTVQAIGPGLWGNSIRVTVARSSAAIANPGGIAATWFRIRVMYYSVEPPTPFVDPFDEKKIADPNRRLPDVYEDFDDLSPDSTRANFVTSVINGASRLIQVTATAGTPTLPAPGAAPVWTRLTNGTEVAITDDDFLDENTADPELRRGLAGLSAIRDISIVAIPDAFKRTGLSAPLQNACDLTRDRFAIHAIDGGDVNAIRPLRDSSYGAIYYPQVLVSASHTPNGWVYVPPVGHLAGIYARTDVDRGVHKAPANEVVRGIITRDLSGGNKPLSHVINKRDQDILNPRGVNVIRDFRTDGRDIRVWGARTMTSDAMWRYINVRRLFIMIEQSIDRGTQWAVFEPNSEPTWIAVRTSIANFLRTVWRNGALMGTTEEEAFFVRCDRTTMTQDDFDTGRLICLIGVAPVKPAEFVIFRISQKTLESES